MFSGTHLLSTLRFPEISQPISLFALKSRGWPFDPHPLQVEDLHDDLRTQKFIFVLISLA